MRYVPSCTSKTSSGRTSCCSTNSCHTASETPCFGEPRSSQWRGRRCGRKGFDPIHSGSWTRTIPGAAADDRHPSGRGSKRGDALRRARRDRSRYPGRSSAERGCRADLAVPDGDPSARRRAHHHAAIIMRKWSATNMTSSSSSSVPSALRRIVGFPRESCPHHSTTLMKMSSSPRGGSSSRTRRTSWRGYEAGKLFGHRDHTENPTSLAQPLPTCR